MFCCDRADVDKSFFGIVTCSECFFEIHRSNKKEQANLVSHYHLVVCKQMHWHNVNFKQPWVFTAAGSVEQV